MAETYTLYFLFYFHQLVEKLRLDHCWLSWGQGTKYIATK